ncbi:hypothetical protein AB4Z48_04850 [Cupriavidus sp. 2TAF22]|uniref:hypothetical protein n=1 Tax=unclassified Cupriavidus TaxID=2640874 RepID=UPI003F93A081
MKQILLTLFSVTTLLSAWPAFAGPDWSVIERARAQARAQRQNPEPSSCLAQHPANHAFCAPRADGGRR